MKKCREIYEEVKSALGIVPSKAGKWGRYYQDRHLRPLPRHQYLHHRTNIKRNAGCWRNPKSRERKRYGIYCQIKDPDTFFLPYFRFICLIPHQNKADKFNAGCYLKKLQACDISESLHLVFAFCLVLFLITIYSLVKTGWRVVKRESWLFTTCFPCVYRHSGHIGEEWRVSVSMLAHSIYSPSHYLSNTLYYFANIQR